MYSCPAPSLFSAQADASTPLPPPQQRRLALDPFLPLATRFQPAGGYTPVWRAWGGDSRPGTPPPSPVDVGDEAYLAQHTAQVGGWV